MVIEQNIMGKNWKGSGSTIMAIEKRKQAKNEDRNDTKKELACVRHMC